MKKVYLSSEQSSAPLSGAYEINGLVFLSGQIHMDASGQLVGVTIEEKFEAIIANVKNILDKVGLSLNDVVRVQLYLTDLTELAALNKVYAKYFIHPLPTRTAIGVSALPLGASVEMDVVAVRD